MHRACLACALALLLLGCPQTAVSRQHPQRVHPTADAPITAVRLSPNGGLLAIGRADGSVVMRKTTSDRVYWTFKSDWRATRGLGVGPGSQYSDTIVALTESPATKLFPPKPAPILGIFFLQADLEVLVVERDGGFYRILTDTGDVIGAHGVFFGVKKDKQLEGIAAADVDPYQQLLAVTGTLQGIPYEIDLRKLEETQPRLSYVILEDSLRRLNIAPGTSAVIQHRLDIKTSQAASAMLLSSSQGNVKELRYCNGGETLVGVTVDGKLVAWDHKDGKIDSNSSYERLGFRNGKGDSFDPGLACAGEMLLSTTPSDKYGNVQLWDTKEGVLVKHFNQANVSFLKETVTDGSGDTVATATSSGVVIWSLENNELKRLGSVALFAKRGVAIQAQPIERVAISRDGSTLAVADRETVFVIDLPGLKVRRQVGPLSITKEVKIGS
jgi:WD40 repeat protein